MPPVDTPQSVDMELAPPSESREEEVRSAAAASTPGARRSPAKRSSAGSPIGLLLGGGVVVLLLVSLVIGRNGIVDKVPAAAAIYQSVGLSIDQDLGLEFDDVTLNWQAEGDVFVLVVEGEIVNLSEDSQVIPPLRMAILDSDGQEIQHESFEIAEGTISGGNRINFSGRMVNPIDQGENFRLTFEQDS
ncbi:MAG: hypothetical protein ACR2QH_12370 [Geminicoccaceae bacterium]|jgi:hypothetical protein